MENKNIYKAIADIMNEVEAIGKNKKNPQQGFMYRGIDDMYNDLQPKFAKHRVFITSEVMECTREERPSKSGGILLWTILKVKFSFYAEDGSSVNSIMMGEAMDSGDKGANKAMSVALKYCLMQLFLIPTEDLKKNDNDGHVYEPKTTAYNHKQLGTPEKPVVMNGQFKSILERLGNGDLSVYRKALDTYTFEDIQRSILEEKYNEAVNIKSQPQTT